MSSLSLHPSSHSATQAQRSRVPGLLSMLTRSFFTWRALRRSRIQLAKLDDRALADIGLTRAQADLEIRRVF